MIPEITCYELKEKLDDQEPVIIVDVREEYELDISKIDQSIHIPLNELEDRLDELDKEKSYVMQCRSGGRSATATQILIDHHFLDVHNLAGGINEWARSIDSSLPVY